VKNLTRNGMLALPVLLVALYAFVGISILHTRRDAAARLDEFRQLGASGDATVTFKSLQRKYGSKLRPIEGCTQQFCQYEINLSNRTVSALRIVPYTELNILFTVYKGSVQIAMLEYRTALRGPQSPVVHVQKGLCAHGCGVRFDVNPHGTTQQMWNGLVTFDTRATPRQRDAALALNLDCFARIGGCKDIIELLPTVWTRTSPGTVTSRLVGLSQQLEESHGFPSPDDF
jgi:hypothetical protein